MNIGNFETGVSGTPGIPDSAKSRTSQLANGTTLILILGVIIAAIVSMTEISLSISAVINVSLLCAILFMVASLVYSSRYAGGIEKARRSEDYIAAKKEYEEAKNEIYSRSLTSELPALCQRYREEELKNYRSALLADVFITYKDYIDKYQGKSKKDLEDMKLSPEAVKAVKKADAAKGLRLASDDLLSVNRSMFRLRISALPTSSESRQKFDITLNTISRFATTMLAGAIAVDMIFQFSFQAVAQWAVRMLPIVWAAIKGERDGEYNIYRTTIPFIVKQTEILKLFIEWTKEKN